MGGVREMGVDQLVKKVSDNKLREHNGKYILYRNGRVESILETCGLLDMQ